MTFAWNRPRSLDANVVGETVTAIAEQSGGVCSPQALVNEARPDSSPLHPMFEWDDQVAAEAHRRQQARQVVRELRIVEQTDEGEQHVQAFVHVIRLNDDRPVEGYRLTRLVVRSVDEYQQVLDEAWSQLAAWKRRYSHLKDLGGILGAVENALISKG